MQVNSFFNLVQQRYIDLSKQPFGIFQLIVSILLVNSFGLWVPTFLNFIQQRPGIHLNDIVLNFIPAIDVSIPLFISCYGVIVIAILIMATHPKMLMMTLQAYTIVTLIRMACIYFVPLEAPVAYVHLIDPFADAMVYAGKPINKDLFFSGHTSTMVLLILGTPFEKLRPYFLVAAITVAILLLVQHAHYFVDVVVAPFASIAVFRLVAAIHGVKFAKLAPVLAEIKS